MFEAIHNKFRFDRLLEDTEKIVIPGNEKYLIAYQEFLQYFKDTDIITRHNTIIGISFTYSWMPTILDIRYDNIGEATKILNNAKQGSRPCSTD